MAWLWASWKEYLDAVQPVSVNSRGLFGMAERGSWFETEHSLYEAIVELTEATASLHELGFTGKGHRRPPRDPSVIEKARALVMDVVHSGEELLLYHKRLAKSRAAYGFLHSHDLLEHWDRYQQTGRLPKEIDQLVVDTDELMNGCHAFTEADESFLVDDLDLPPDLEADFRLARNLFSVGFDEVGLVMAGRGLEGVLRKLADVRQITLDTKGKSLPACEADIYDLIETIWQLRWKTKKTRLITSETKALLHYLRSLRNRGAHALRPGMRRIVSPRETAAVVAESANQLWNEVATTRARLATTTVQKTW